MIAKPKFAILITTKNRLNDLTFTLSKLAYLLQRNDLEFIICDDGSNDGTWGFIRQEYPAIKLIRNSKSKGLIYSRNRLLKESKASFAISLDDDLHFVSDNYLEIIESYFQKNPKCAIVSFRIFWNINPPIDVNTNDVAYRMKGFAGGAHVIRIKAWKIIPNYPEWFVFYGEEDFAAFQLFKKGWEIHYVPAILAHHRVDIKSRKKDKDYRLRLRRSFRSGWYLYVLFYPWKLLPKKMIYTLWMQLKLKVFKGDFIALVSIIQAIGDVLLNMPRLLKNANRLTKKEFSEYEKLPSTKLYWLPEEN